MDFFSSFSFWILDHPSRNFDGPHLDLLMEGFRNASISFVPLKVVVFLDFLVLSSSEKEQYFEEKLGKEKKMVKFQSLCDKVCLQMTWTNVFQSLRCHLGCFITTKATFSWFLWQQIMRFQNQ